MSVRRQKYRDRKTGAEKRHWLVDVMFQHPDGRIERVRKVSPIQTRRGAEQYERDLRDKLLLGERRSEALEVPTLRVFAEKFLEVYAKATNKPSEVHTKERILRGHLVPALGRLKLHELGPEHIVSYRAQKRATHSDKTVNNHLTVLRRLLAVAVEWNVIDNAPRVDGLKSGQPDLRWLTDDELYSLVEATEPEWRTAILVAARVGLRMGELRALRWSDIDLRGALLHVRQAAWTDKIGTPKGGRAREIPLCDEARQALEAHPRRLLGDLVFGDANGELVTTSGIQWRMEQATNRAELEGVGWHTMRHTFASQLVMRGVALPVVQRLLGHADIRTTMRYAHLAPAALRDGVAVFNVLPGGKLTANQAKEAATA